MAKRFGANGHIYREKVKVDPPKVELPKKEVKKEEKDGGKETGK